MRKRGYTISLMDVCIGATIISSVALRNFRFLLYGIQILMLLLCGKKLLRHVNARYLVSTVIFFGIAAASVLWARNQSKALSFLISLGQIYLLCIVMSGYLHSRSNIDKFLMFFVIATIIMMVNALISTPLSEWSYIIRYGSGKYVNRSSGQARLGSTIGMHPNALGQSCAICLCCVLYVLKCTGKKRISLLLLPAAIMLVFSKSRTSLLAAGIGAGLFYIMLPNRRVKIIMRMIGAMTIALLTLWAVINIPLLYTLVGYRIEGILALLTGGNADASTTTRIDFIRIGLDIFKDYPLFGVGINNYSVVAYKGYNTWAETYAHNTYIEVLADTGIIGFVIYYSGRFYALFSIAKLYLHRNRIDAQEHLLLAFLMSMMIMLTLMDMAHVTINVESYQFIQLLCMISPSTIYRKAALNESIS